MLGEVHDADRSDTPFQSARQMVDHEAYSRPVWMIFDVGVSQ